MTSARHVNRLKRKDGDDAVDADAFLQMLTMRRRFGEGKDCFHDDSDGCHAELPLVTLGFEAHKGYSSPD